MNESPYAACQKLRAHRVGRLIAFHADGLETRAESCHFIIDGQTGDLVFPISSVMMDLNSHVVCVPEESGGEVPSVLELQVSISHEPPVEMELRDRHLAYHGRIGGGLWVRARIDSGRFEDSVFDGVALSCGNALLGDEMALCRRCNSEQSVLARAVEHRCGGQPSDAVAVGVDGFGVDVRTGTRVVRLAFVSEARTGDEALIEIEAMLSGGMEA